MALNLLRRMAAELLGTGFLSAAVVGSGIMATRVVGADMAMTLLASSLASAATLYALIAWLAPLSGAHFNPVLTIVLEARAGTSGRDACGYVLAQLVGAIGGVMSAHEMFGMPLLSASSAAHGGLPQLLGEFMSTFGLVGIVYVGTATRQTSLASAVAAYVGGAFWFTPTDVANPALAIARALTDSFAGIRPLDVPGFIAAEVAGAVAATAVCCWLLGADRRGAVELSDSPGTPMN